MFKKLLKEKKGFVAIEAVISMSMVLGMILLVIGFFTLLYPRIMLSIDIHELASTAKIQGGLTDQTSQPVNSDVAVFKQQLAQAGYDPSTISVAVTTIPSGLNALGVTPLNQPGSNYIHRDSKELIKVTVSVPANTYIDGPLKLIGVNGGSGISQYTVSETVMSERW